MTRKADLFVSDAGTEVSVRTSRDLSSDAVLIEPLYATDIEVLDGATGELRADGKALRGTLLRDGGRFVLSSERPSSPMTPKTDTPSVVSGVQALPTRAASVAEPPLQASETAPPDPEVLEAADTVSRFARGESDVPLKAAREAHSVLDRFIAERERQLRTRKPARPGNRRPK